MWQKYFFGGKDMHGMWQGHFVVWRGHTMKKVFATLQNDLVTSKNDIATKSVAMSFEGWQGH